MKFLNNPGACCVFLFLVSGLLAGPLSAQVITVDDPSDYAFGAGPGSSSDTTGCTLRKAIANANNAAQTFAECATGTSGGNEIVLNVNDPIVFGSMGGPIFINRSLTITGSATIDGDQQGEIFRVNSSNVHLELNGLTLRNGSNGAVSVNNANSSLTATGCAFLDNAHPGSGGGAITSTGALHITGCHFQDNAANGSGGGGAIRLSSSDPSTITASSFLNNSAKTSGGAIYYSSSGNMAALLISLSVFTNNSAKADGGANEGGGAIWHQNGLLTVIESIFAHNQVKGDEGRGGALYLANGSPVAVLEFNLFTLNKAKGNKGMGGAIFAARAALANGNSFIGNSADDEGMGGAIANMARVKTSLIETAPGFLVSNSTFNDNSAEYGGAIYNSGPENGSIERGITLVNVTVAGNQAASAGGGIYNREVLLNRKPEADVRNTIIANNSPDNCASSDGEIPILNNGGNLLWNGACPATSPLPQGNPKLAAPEPSVPHILTMPLQAGSAALQTANAQTCADFPVLNLDQRLVPRPSPAGTVCDVGAHESSLGPPSPALAAAPGGGLAFGSVPENTAVTLPAIISNPGTLPLTGLQLNVSGTGFSQASTTCGSSLAGGESCQVQVQFLPQSIGAASGQLSASANDNLQAALALSGSGFEVVLGLDVLPASGLAFGEVPVNGSSPSMEVTVQSTSTIELTGLDFNLDAPFHLIDPLGTCGTSLAAEQSCSLFVSFAPTDAGPVSGNLLVTTDQGPNGSILLSGFGTTPPELHVDPSVDFGQQEVGTTSNSKLNRLRNLGTETATGISWAAGFPYFSIAPFELLSTDCGPELAGGQECTFELIFAPSAVGSRHRTLVISASNHSNIEFALTGTGFIPPKLRLETPDGDDFGPVLTGTTSPQKSITVHNDGGQPLVGLSATVNAPFSVTNTSCGASLDPGLECRYRVVASPYQDGVVFGSISVSADGGFSEQVGLQATGYTPGDVVIEPQTGLAFGSVPVGTVSPAQALTLFNPGSRDMWLEDMNPPSQVQIVSNDCPMVNNSAVFAGGASCTVELAFAPSSAGSLADVFQVTGYTPPLFFPIVQPTVPLSGEAFNQGPQLRFEPVEGLDFGPVAIGANSQSLTAILKNISASDASITLTFPPSGEFPVQTLNCSPILPANSECSITMTFSPGSVGNVVNKLTATSTGTEEQLTLRGHGFDASQPVLRTDPVTPGPLSFITRPGESDVRQVQISNLGNALLSVGQPSLGGAQAGDFMVLSPLPLELNSGQSAMLQIACTPNGGGYRSALLTLASTDPDQPSINFALSCISIVPLFTDRFAEEIIH
jgi:predicted outer membrane repeat protein